MAQGVTVGVVLASLDWAFERAVKGAAGVDSARVLADDYLTGEGDLVDKVRRLIRHQAVLAAAAGFVSGFGGMASMPVMVPVNLASVMFVQMRMIAAIALMGGHDLKEEHVKLVVLACLAGDAAKDVLKDVLKDVGIVIGTRMAVSALRNVSGKTLSAVNRAVGRRLFGAAGRKGPLRVVPLMGGLVGGTLDALATRVIGRVALAAFVGGAEGGTLR